MNTTVLILAAGGALFAAWCCEMLAAENRRLRSRCERWQEMARSLDAECDHLTERLMKECLRAERHTVYHAEVESWERN